MVTSDRKTLARVKDHFKTHWQYYNYGFESHGITAFMYAFESNTVEFQSFRSSMSRLRHTGFMAVHPKVLMMGHDGEYCVECSKFTAEHLTKRLEASYYVKGMHHLSKVDRLKIGPVSAGFHFVDNLLTTVEVKPCLTHANATPYDGAQGIYIAEVQFDFRDFMITVHYHTRKSSSNRKKT